MRTRTLWRRGVPRRCASSRLENGCLWQAIWAVGEAALCATGATAESVAVQKNTRRTIATTNRASAVNAEPKPVHAGCDCKCSLVPFVIYRHLAGARRCADGRRRRRWAKRRAEAAGLRERGCSCAGCGASKVTVLGVQAAIAVSAPVAAISAIVEEEELGFSIALCGGAALLLHVCVLCKSQADSFDGVEQAARVRALRINMVAGTLRLSRLPRRYTARPNRTRQEAAAGRGRNPAGG